MARRAIAAVSACLFTVGAAPAVPASASAVSEPPAGCAAAARVTGPGRVPEPRAPGPEQAAEMLADLARRQSVMRLGPWTPITVSTWVHVISAGPLGAQDTAVRRQIDTLNAAYSGRLGGVDTGIQFRLDGLIRTDNVTWFRDPVTYESSIKRGRKGGAETLNLYIAQLSRLVLGYSTYPYWYRTEPGRDGVVIDWRSLPGGSLRNFDRGFTGVHEIGHWLGLLHTFEKGCEAPGDGVADTAPQGKPTEGCPAHMDTCKGGEPDPIHNFMDYSHDRCMSEFTTGQAARMHEMWAAYRAPAPDTTLDG